MEGADLIFAAGHREGRAMCSVGERKGNTLHFKDPGTIFLMWSKIMQTRKWPYTDKEFSSETPAN